MTGLVVGRVVLVRAVARAAFAIETIDYFSNDPGRAGGTESQRNDIHDGRSGERSCSETRNKNPTKNVLPARIDRTEGKNETQRKSEGRLACRPTSDPIKVSFTRRRGTYLTPSLAATRFHCERCDRPLSLLTALHHRSTPSRQKRAKRRRKDAEKTSSRARAQKRNCVN